MRFVGLTARTAEELGYVLTEEDKARNFIEVSGRKGFGVKADDLIDRMIAAGESKRWTRGIRSWRRRSGRRLRRRSAWGRCGFFLLRFTRNTVIGV